MERMECIWWLFSCLLFPDKDYIGKNAKYKFRFVKHHAICCNDVSTCTWLNLKTTNNLTLYVKF